ncbi:MAG TPA: alpha/beta hydrolase [Acidimicrobiales bacterium]|nr:alpha/beta hydrolase [Acidimicrobiales bacterium]
MPTASTGGVEIAYELSGFPPRGHLPLLFVQGLGGQLISWDEAFFDKFTERGFGVVRFDNRDSGFSTKFETTGLGHLGQIINGESTSAAYSISDMANDAAGLVNALGIGPVHVVGVSMGGMISQALAIGHPNLVASLCSIMSSTGDRSVGSPTAEALDALLKPPPSSREEAIESGLATWRVIWGGGYPFEEEMIQDKIGREYDRSFYPAGVARQIGAIVTAIDRTDALGKLRMPALVIHGDQDPLITFSGGEATASAIAGSRFLALPGVGHCIPRPLWDTVVDAIIENAIQAEVERA